MKIIIETRDNGCTLTCKEDNQNTVYRFDEDNITDLLCLLYQVSSIVYQIGGKWDKHRLEIRDVHGSGYVCKDSKCSICHNK